MMQTELSVICDFFKLGMLVEEPQFINSKKLWCLKTTKGCFALKKLSAKNLYQNPPQGERIAKAFSKSNLPVVCALSFKNQFILQVYEKYFMVFPWMEGQALNILSILHCYSVGKVLGKIHKTNLKLNNVNAATWYEFNEPDWCSLLMNIPYDLDVTLDELKKWSHQCKNALVCLSKEKVISHGDLSQNNIIWLSLEKPMLIDWEAAGWLHPQVELFGVAINCSDFISNSFNHQKFMAVIEGYFSVTSQVAIDEYVLYGGLGSWLSWLNFNLIQQSFGDQTVKLKVQNTVRIIRQLIDLFPTVMPLLNFFQKRA